MLANCIYIRTFTIAMSKVSKSFFLFFLFTALLVSFSCNKDDLKWDLPRTNSLDSVQTSVGPTLSTIVASSVSQYTATSGGAGINDNGSPITEKGVCWSTNSNPTVSDSHTSDGTGTADFSSQLTGLNSNTQYYVRAYATNSAGTGYGSNVVLTTTTNPIATISTSSVTNIGQQSANCGGTIISNGGSAITSSGICWSIAVNPTVSDAHTSNGSSSGSFVSQLTNLNPSTTYYVRAYATTSAGTGYGQSVTFTTSNLPPPTAVGTESCGSLNNVNSLYYGMNGTNGFWGISPNGYSGTCWVAPHPNNSGQLGTAVGNASTPHYTQFTRTFNNSGYMEMWINTPNGNGYNNVIPTIYVDGIALSSTTIEGQSSAFYWLKLRTSGITAGTHTIKIQFVGSYYTFKVDEITFFEYQ